MGKKLYIETSKKIDYQIWKKGRELAETGKVINYLEETEIKDRKEVNIISGIVKGFPAGIATIIYNPKNERLIECSCTCDTTVSKKNMCEHIAALLQRHVQNPLASDIMIPILKKREEFVTDILVSTEKVRVNIFLEISKDICPITKKNTVAVANLKIGNEKIGYFDFSNKVEYFIDNYKIKTVALNKNFIFDHFKYELNIPSHYFLVFMKELKEFFNEKSSYFIKENKIIIPYILIEKFIDYIRMMSLNIADDVVFPKVIIDTPEKRDIKLYTNELSSWESLGSRFIISEVKSDNEIKCGFIEVGEEGKEIFDVLKQLSKNDEIYLGLIKADFSKLITKLKKCCQVIQTNELLKEFYNLKKDDIRPGILVELQPDDTLIVTPKIIFDSRIRENESIFDVPIDFFNNIHREMKKKDICAYISKNNDEISYRILDNKSIFYFMTTKVKYLQKYFPTFMNEKLRKRKFIKASLITKINITDVLSFSFKIEGITNEELREILKKSEIENSDLIVLKNKNMVEIKKEELRNFTKQMVGLQITLEEFKKGVAIRNSYYKYFLGNSKALIYEPDFIARYGDVLKNYPSLREYQKEGINWLMALKENNIGGILADDMGLGKTIQCIVFLDICISHLNKEQKNLILAPKSLLDNWASEFKKFAPHLKIKVISGLTSYRKEKIEKIENGEIVITSYSCMLRDFEEYKRHQFENILFDEAQIIKNYKTKLFKIMAFLQGNSKYHLTGTPIENNLKEIWGLFEIILPNYLGKGSRFNKMNEKNENIEILKSLIRPFILRRLKSEVSKELPPKIETDLMVELDKKQKLEYMKCLEKLKIDLINEKKKRFKGTTTFVAINHLRHICSYPEACLKNYTGGNAKAEALEELLERYIGAGHNVLVFSQFTSGLRLLEKRLTKKGYMIGLLQGSLGLVARSKLIQKFREGKINVFLISLKAGGFGLNLTEADVVIHLDPWWNETSERQATDRAHRIGQTKTVFVTNLIAKGTIEERLRMLKKEKKDMIDTVLDEEYIDFSKLDDEKIDLLFKDFLNIF